MSMMRNKLSAILPGVLCIAALVLAGCGVTPEKEYYQPKNDSEFQACFNYCKGQRFRCRNVVQAHLRACDERYEQAYRIFERCVALSNNSRRNRCSRPTSCPAPDYNGCTGQFDACFIGCGGRIITNEDTVSDQ